VSTFQIKKNGSQRGKAVKVEEVGEELGVRYILEGSVRKAIDRGRITAQLVDATTGGHLWTERYDRQLEDIFALQDEVTQEIVSVLAVKLTEDEKTRRACKCQYTCNTDAYDYFLRGLEYFHSFTKKIMSGSGRCSRKPFRLVPDMHCARNPAFSMP